MDAIKRRLSDGGVDHIEKDVEVGVRERRPSVEAAIAQHREDDDRAEEAKGRNADEMDKKYWRSVNYVCPLRILALPGRGKTF